MTKFVNSLKLISNHYKLYHNIVNTTYIFIIQHNDIKNKLQNIFFNHYADNLFNATQNYFSNIYL